MTEPAPLSAFSCPPSLDALRALLAFAEAGSVAGAARALQLSQPTLSRQLGPFQKRDGAGAAILVRRGRNLEFSEKGRAALPAIRELVRQYEQFDQFFKGTNGRLQTTRLGIGSFGAEHYLPRALAALKNGDPPCEIETQIVRGQERIIGVLEGRFDVAVVTHDPRQIQTIVSASTNPRAKLAVEALAEHGFCILACNRTRLANELRAAPANRPVPMALLAQGEFVGLDRQSGIRLQLEAEFQKFGQPLRFVAQASAGGWAAAKAYARHGLGAAIVPLAALTAGDEKHFTLRRLPERFAVTDFIVRRQPAPGSPEPALLAALHQAASEHLKEVRETWKALL